MLSYAWESRKIFQFYNWRADWVSSNVGFCREDWLHKFVCHGIRQDAEARSRVWAPLGCLSPFSTIIVLRLIFQKKASFSGIAVGRKQIKIYTTRPPCNFFEIACNNLLRPKKKPQNPYSQQKKQIITFLLARLSSSLFEVGGDYRHINDRKKDFTTAFPCMQTFNFISRQQTNKVFYCRCRLRQVDALFVFVFFFAMW